MRCRERWMIRSTGFLLVFSLLHSSVFAWCPIAHYLIARAAAKAKGIHNPNYPVEHYANLPDYRESKEWYLPVRDGTEVGQQVTPPFCWSHAVQDTGVLGVGWRLVVPNEFCYPGDGRYPGPVMRELLNNKLDLRGVAPFSIKHWDLMNTVNGFRAHNAADRVVHCEFFRAAQLEMDEELRREAWIIHHGLKEVYADYVVLRKYGYGDAETIKFVTRYKVSFLLTGPSQSILNKWAYTQEEADRIKAEYTSFMSPYYWLSTTPCGLVDTRSDNGFILWGNTGAMSLGFKGNAPLMHVAQSVFRKNRFSTRRDGSPLSFEVEEVEVIKNQLAPGKSDEAKHVLTLFDNPCWAVWRKLNIPLTDLGYIDSNGSLVEMKNPIPEGNEAEYTKLKEVKQFLATRFINSKKQYPAWTLWADDLITGQFDTSVVKAEQWMYTSEELKLRHH